jgi:hypothetical protein
MAIARELAKEIYEKYMRILEVTIQTCATMLALVFAFTLANRQNLTSQVWVTITIVFLTGAIIFSGAGIVLAKKDEPNALRGFALISFAMLIGVIVAMILLLLFTIWPS